MKKQVSYEGDLFFLYVCPPIGNKTLDMLLDPSEELQHNSDFNC